MNITLSKQGRVSVVNLNGNFDIASSKPFDEEMTALIDAGRCRMSPVPACECS